MANLVEAIALGVLDGILIYGLWHAVNAVVRLIR
jgi:hypothetical protein